MCIRTQRSTNGCWSFMKIIINSLVRWSSDVAAGCLFQPIQDIETELWPLINYHTKHGDDFIDIYRVATALIAREK